jgi:hypothetical protein
MAENQDKAVAPQRGINGAEVLEWNTRSRELGQWSRSGAEKRKKHIGAATNLALTCGVA